MLNRPVWLRLFAGGLGESHAADLLQHTVDTHNNGRDTLAADHSVALEGGSGPQHVGVRWARAVACLDISQIPIEKITEPGEPGRVMWSDGFKTPPYVSTKPDAISNPYDAAGWWVNWELEFSGSDNPRQDILLGYEMRSSATSPVIEGPTDAFRSRFWQDGRVGSFLLSSTLAAPGGDGDPTIYGLVRQMRRIFLVVR